MTGSRPQPVERDSRGILDPRALQQRVRLTRHPVPDPLAGLIDRFWAVEWNFGPGESFRQDVVTHPGANISVAPDADGAPRALLYGVSRTLVSRELTGTGWAVAAMTRPGGLGPFVREPVAVFNDRVLPVDDVTDLDGARLVADTVAPGDVAAAHTVDSALSGAVDTARSRAVDSASSPAVDSTGPVAVEIAARAAVLAAALVDALARADPRRVAGALEVTAVARRAETDRSLSRVDDLAAVAGVGVRTLQRMFREYAGVSPTWVLRRYRLIDAAELVRDGSAVSWAEVAEELGYADQAHLIRDFRSTVGRTPAVYAAEVAASAAAPAQTTRR